MWQIRMNDPAQLSENLEQQAARGHAIHIVIAENRYDFLALARLEQPLDRRAHVRQRKRIAKLLQAWLEKSSSQFRIIQPAIQEALRQQFGNPKLAGEPRNEQRLRGFHDPAILHEASMVGKPRGIARAEAGYNKRESISLFEWREWNPSKTNAGGPHAKAEAS